MCCCFIQHPPDVAGNATTYDDQIVFILFISTADFYIFLWLNFSLNLNATRLWIFMLSLRKEMYMFQTYLNYFSRPNFTAAAALFVSDNSNSYLPGWEVNRDHEGGSSRARLFLCTLNELTPASVPNADTSIA